MTMIPQIPSLAPATRAPLADQPGSFGDEAAARDFLSVLGAKPTPDGPTEDPATAASAPLPTQPGPVEGVKEPAVAPDSVAAQPIAALMPALPGDARPTPARNPDASGVDHPEKLRPDVQVQTPPAVDPSPTLREPPRQAPLATPSEADPPAQSPPPEADRATSAPRPDAPSAPPGTRHLAGSAETSLLLRAVDLPGSTTLPEPTGLPVQDQAGAKDRITAATPEPDPGPVAANPASAPSAMPDSAAEPAVIARRANPDTLSDKTLPQSPPNAPTHATQHYSPSAIAGPNAPAPPARHMARTAEVAVLLRATDQTSSTADPTTAPPPDPATGQPRTIAVAAPPETATVAQALSPDTPAIPQPPALTTPAAPLQTPLHAPPEPSAAPVLPAATAPALVLAVGQNGGGTVELVLTPEDLGRLRFEVTQTGDQMRIHLTVERPETLDLLRRNADQLLSEFRQAGYAGATLSFAQGGQGGQHPPAAQPAAQPQAPSALPPELQTTAPKAQGQLPAGGLDLRL